MLKRIDTLYIDFDCCLVDTIQCIISLYNEDFQYYKKFQPVNWWEVNTWDFAECSCASKEYINTYFNQKRFFDRLEFMPNAEESVNILREYYDVKIVTHGYSPNLIGKKIWIDEHLGLEMIGVNLKKYKDKSHIDMKNGFFLDDNSKNVLTSNAKDKAVFGEKYQWNEDWNGLRLCNWTDVLRYLL